MEYTYTGSAHMELRASYADDDSRFRTRQSSSFPERNTVIEETRLLRKLLFPGCWNAADIVDDEAALRETLEELGGHFCNGIQPYGPDCLSTPVEAVLDELPAIRQQLKQDVEAAYKGDPAATSYVEIIRSYPGLHAMMVHRVAHALYDESQPAYARELAEAAHTATGIDIHPGAEIGEYFFIDHGSGVVIGETATIGDWVRLYQAVTLGALHFEEEEDDEQTLKKGYKRHPDIGDNVVIGAGSKILGPITIGDHVSIEANAWVTDDVPAHTNVFIKHPEQTRKPVDDQ
ncbi:serine O-acetyltransferase [Halohasta litchfieldiae]|jgi:serine O-acetyltransferase|uniref:serine O-acetyltransferase n=1 Tax=Halohasta litchfieldiae TaxID=1073996 RepID=A0A1H6QXI7_9EURY|nr:serine O-acetyltransferase EpsC [Halohasta litchfieldiae]ATW88577.1 serine O-acetyltransferase [Halohasta litchfieldiae]SEI48421.1 serine O-acetyltransferase [Halohasta litchfieldiae]